MASRYGMKYEQYSSKDPELNLTMDYIAGWRYIESRGSYNSYAQVQFLGPLQQDFAPSFAVTMEPRLKVKFRPLTIEGLANDLVVKRMKLKEAEVLSRSKIKLSGLDAIDITLAYKKPDKLRSIDAKFVPFKERVVIFQKQDKFYSAQYVNPTREFSRFARQFSHCLKTIKFKSD